MTTRLSGKPPPKAVEYEIVVKDTGETPVKVEKIADAGVPGCATAPLKPGLAPGEEVVEASCSDAFTKAGTFTNVATVEGNHKSKESHKVETELKDAGFEAVKKQRFAGGAFVTSKLSGRPPAKTVEYEIVVKNTGEVPVKVETITDASVPGCEATPKVVK